MRATLLSRFLTITLLSTAFAAPPADVKGRVEVPEAALDVPQPQTKAQTEVADTTDTTDGGSAAGTTFKGHPVPAITEIHGEKIDETIADGYW